MGDLSVKPRDCPLAVTEYNSLENELKPLDKTEIKAQFKKKKKTKPATTITQLLKPHFCMLIFNHCKILAWQRL